ncbi:MAG: hypothetical protein JWP14_3376 [Frankiales bacterium]|nr:hypothetical protein [Frankiales bacterium]
MLPGAPFPDSQQLVLEALIAAGLVAPEDAGTVTPKDLQQRTQFVRARRLGGPDDGLTDTARVDVDWYMPVAEGVYEQLRDAAEAGRQVLIAGPHRLPSGVIDRVTTTQAPTERPADDERVWRRQATYTVQTRRR